LSNRIKLGVLTSSISRNSGGLFGALSSLYHNVYQRGCIVDVFSLADDFSEKDANQWEGVELHLLPQLGPSAFGYAPALFESLKKVKPEIIHAHGLWMYPSMVSLRFSRQNNLPLIISPHGMLDPWAVRRSAKKKLFASMLFEHAHLRRATCIHALCKSEYEAIRSFGLTNPVAVIPNGVDVPDINRNNPEPKWANDFSDRCRILLFLGRIHPKKGLINLLQGWTRIKQKKMGAVASWHLVIVGWDQGGHEAELKRLVNEFGINDQVHFIGPLFGEEKIATFAKADAFILPSFSEGLPMSVLEAWSCSLPTLITKECNLPDGFKAGATLEMTQKPESIEAALENLFSMTKAERNAMGNRGYQLVKQKYSWNKIGKEMVSVYEWIIGGGPPPDCVIIDS